MKKSFIDRLFRAVKATDAKEFEAALTKDEASEEETPAEKKDEETEEKTEDKKKGKSKDADLLASLVARVSALESKSSTKDAASEEEEKTEEKKENEPTADDMEDRDGDETEEEEKKSEVTADKKKKGKSKDSAALRNDFQDVLSRAEVLSPGIKVPTFDAKADAKKAQDSLCALKRKALASASENPKFRDALSPLVGPNPGDFKTLDCATLAATFIGASEIVKLANKGAVTAPARDSQQQNLSSSIAAMNAANAKHWGRS